MYAVAGVLRPNPSFNTDARVRGCAPQRTPVSLSVRRAPHYESISIRCTPGLPLACASALVSVAFAQRPVPIDQVPMYGGLDRSAVPALKEGDQRFITEASTQFGSREKASEAWVSRGFTLHQRDELADAMRRFNQAWLLDPKNPNVFHGFSAVLYDKGDNCGAMLMSERAIALGLASPDFLADAALLLSLCSIDQKRPSDLDKSDLLRRSDELFNTASGKAAKDAYVFDKWWQALYWRGEYREAWSKVFAMRSAGRQPQEAFLRELRKKLPEPTQ